MAPRSGPFQRFDLSGKVAMVTGAGGGIGRASAELLAAAGAIVVCVDVTGLEQETAALIAAAGGEAVGRSVDVSQRPQVDAVVDEIFRQHGRLDILANVAAIPMRSSIVDLEPSDLDRILSVNLEGVLYCCQAAVRIMTRQGSGSIINFSSGGIDGMYPEIGPYAISKAAVTQLSRTLAVEAGPAGVRVNTIAPGMVETPMTAGYFTRPDGSIDEAKRDAYQAPFVQASALRRIASAEDIAHTVLFLASDAASFWTGQILRPNGGTHMPW